jgi:glycosyl transferase family 87
VARSAIAWLSLIVIAIVFAAVWGLPRATSYYRLRNTPTSKPNIDFYAYYTAARALQRGIDPYRDQGLVDSTLSDPRGHGWSRYIYPAALLPLLAPVASIDYEGARALWLALNLSVFGVGLIVVVWSRPPPDRPLAATVGLWVTAISHPLLFHIRQGQADLIVATLAALAFVLSERGRRAGSAALLAASSWIKIHSVAVLATLAVHARDKRFAGWYVAFAAAIGLLSLGAVPIRWHVEYVTAVLPSLSGGAGYFQNQSLIRLVPPVGVLPQIVSLAGFAGFAFLAWRIQPGSPGTRAGRHDPGGDERALLFLANVLVLLLFSPIAWHMAYVWSILPAALAAPACVRRAGPLAAVLSAAALVLMHVRVAGRPVQNAVNIFGACVLLMCVLWILARPRERSTTPAG